jgi:ribonuclease HII
METTTTFTNDATSSSVIAQPIDSGIDSGVKPKRTRNTNTARLHKDAEAKNEQGRASYPRNATEGAYSGLQKSFSPDSNKCEIGIDEAGRGPLFGRLYVAGVVLPKDDSFRHQDMKDSKKFHSPKKIKEVSDYIKQHAIAWHIQYVSETTIDQINIRQSVLHAMRECAKQCVRQMTEITPEMKPADDFLLLVDGNDFVCCSVYDEAREESVEIPHQTIEGGDNTYTSIAAASILAKVARDEYIGILCAEFPELDARYGISQNKGYGTKQHLDGIREHGICEWHRKSYGICARAPERRISEGGR